MEPVATSGTPWSEFFIGVRYDHLTGLLLAVYELKDEAALHAFLRENSSGLRFDDSSLQAVIEIDETLFIPAAERKAEG